MKTAKILLLILASLSLCLTACKEGVKEASGEAGEPVSIILDYLPNAIHTAFYTALEEGLYTDQGLDVELIAPTSTSDTLRLMSAGKANFGLAPLIDILKARENGEPVVIVSGVVQTPLACVITTGDSGIRRPKDFEGRTIGTSGIPGDEIIIRSMMINDGADPEKVKFLNIGYNLVPNLAAGRIDAVIGFWTQEAIQFKASGGDPYVIRMEDYGFPRFPEIVMFCREEMVNEHPETVRRLLAATAKGSDWSVLNTDAAVADLAAHIEGMAADELMPFFQALVPVLKGDAPAYGYMDVQGISDYAEWAASLNLIELTTPVTSFVTNEFIPTE